MRPDSPLDLNAVAQAFRGACRAELRAFKPGNVHVFRAGHGMTVATFEKAAEVAAIGLVAGATVGERIERAVKASVSAVRCNANLGIILLAAPLAEAALTIGPEEELRASLGRVLRRLTVADAEAAYRAIALANPGGLGSSDAQDVAAPPTVDLSAAMALAAGRDRIALQYGTDFEDVFGAAAAYGMRTPGREAVEDVYLGLLSLFRDSHLERKFGTEIAERTRREAAAFAVALDAEPDRDRALDAFDLHLKSKGLNPGTSADLTVAALFAVALQERVSGRPD